jgi:putative endonuclease
MKKEYYIYVLGSLKDGKMYTGFTKDIKLRYEQHEMGQVPSARHRRP